MLYYPNQPHSPSAPTDIGTAARALPELERMMKEIYGEL
jgi:hypothetical protein